MWYSRVDMPHGPSDTLFGSLIRAKILRFFLVQPEGRWVGKDELAKRLRLSRSQVQKEFSRLCEMRILDKRKIGGGSSRRGRKKSAQRKKKTEVFFLNEAFLFRDELKTIVLRTLPPFSLQALRTLRSAGKIQLLIFTGALIGDHSLPTDVLMVGENLRRTKILRVLKNLENEVDIDLRYTIFSNEEFRERKSLHDRFIRDILEAPHHRLIDALLKKEDKIQEQKTENATLPLGA